MNEQKKFESNYEITNLNLHSNQFYDSYSFLITPKYN